MMNQTPGEQIVGLLTLCQQLQSGEEGLGRPAPAAGDEVMYGIAQRILKFCACAASFDPLLAMQSRLADVGRRLEEKGLLQTNVGGIYALAWMERQAGKEIAS